MRTPQGEGQEGVRPATETELNGVVQESRSVGVENRYRNPGATPNLRGVEPNTNMTNGFPNDAPLTGTMTSGDLAIGGTSMADHDDAETNVNF